jgi:hypothetical protein
LPSLGTTTCKKLRQEDVEQRVRQTCSVVSLASYILWIVPSTYQSASTIARLAR